MNTMPTEPIKDYPIAKSLCQAGTPAFLVDRRKSVAGGTSGGGGRGAIGATEAGDGGRRTPWAGTTGTIERFKPRSAPGQVALLNIIGHRPCPPYERQHISVCVGRAPPPPRRQPRSDRTERHFHRGNSLRLTEEEDDNEAAAACISKMEADGGFLSRRRMAVEVEVPRGDGGGGGGGVAATGVTGGGAAEILWRGGRVLNTGGFFGGGGGFSPRTAPTAAAVAAAAGMEPDFASTPHRTPTPPPPPELCAFTSTPEGDADAEYEGLPRGVPTTTHMMAGAVAGVMEHCVMFPVDCVKTRMQSLRPDAGVRYRNVVDALRQIVRTEGLWRPVRGVNVMAAGAGPAHAMYFACYEKIKFSLSNTIHPGANSHFANGTFCRIASGTRSLC
ncbi:hypothetical protein CRUP_023775 [Coryphaenoides rupestris]|nr:hypothetical protein CRUP_023775 [Coryphaenoides rupestris]